MVAELQKGDEVITNGGILGKIIAINADYISLEITKGTHLKIQRNSIQNLMPKGTIRDQEKI
jgi:preprotein translocase subunit YajC